MTQRPPTNKPDPIQTYARSRVTFALPSAEERVEFKRLDAASEEISPWVDPASMTEAQRAELVRKINEGEVFSLRFRAVVFGDAGNQNRTELEAKHVKQLAKSAGKHHQNLLDGHGGSWDGSPASPIVGEVLAGKAAKREDGSGETVLMLDHRIADRRAMEQFARGLWRTFSISIGAEGWEYVWLDEDGNETDDFWGAESYYVRPVGDVFLVHNAFVADPAYLGTAIIQPHGARTIEEARRMAAESKDKTGSEEKGKGAGELAAAEVVRLSAELGQLRADLAAATARADKAEGELAAERAAHFRTVFDGAVGSGKALRAEEPMYELVAKSHGVSEVSKMLSLRAGTVAPMSTVGLPPAATPAPAPSVEHRAGESRNEHVFGSEEADKAFIQRSFNQHGAATKKKAGKTPN